MIEIEHLSQDSIDVVLLKGRLGAADSADVATRITGIFEEGSGELHIDMVAVEWVDSSGLSALVNILKRVRSQEGTLVLLNVNERVRALLEMTRLHEIFEIRDGEGDVGGAQKVSGF